MIEQPQDGLQINVREALKLSNDESLLRLLGSELVTRLLKMGDTRKQAETAVWTVLSRPPTGDEVAALSAYVARHTVNDAERARLAREAGERREAVERARKRTAEIEKDMADFTNRHRTTTIRTTLEQTGRYLTATADLRISTFGRAINGDEVAARNGLDAALLGAGTLTWSARSERRRWTRPRPPMRCARGCTPPS